MSLEPVKRNAGVKNKEYEIKGWKPKLDSVFPYVSQTVEVKVIDKKDAEEKLTKAGATGRKTTIIVGDETGVMRGVVWGKYIDKIRVGGVYRITNFYPVMYFGQINFKLKKGAEIIPINKKIRVNLKNNFSKNKYVDFEEEF